MTAFDYARAQATAGRLIGDRFGQAATLRRPAQTGTAYDPTTTWTSYAVKVVVQQFSNREVDGTRILSGDKRVLMSATGLAVTPATTDTLLIGSVAHQIVEVLPMSPGGVVVYYELRCRR